MTAIIIGSILGAIALAAIGYVGAVLWEECKLTKLREQARRQAEHYIHGVHEEMNRDH